MTRNEPTHRRRRLGEVLRELRLRAGLSQQEAADRLNHDHRKISRIEKGQKPDYHGMRAMLDTYGVPLMSPPSGSGGSPLSVRDRGVAVWRKSSRSNTGGNGNCVEVALVGGSARVRDSKNPAGPTVALPDWQAFLAAAKRGRFEA